MGRGRGCRFDKETADAHKAVTAMLKEYPWIESEKQLFGRPGSDYDWAATDPKKARERMKEVRLGRGSFCVQERDGRTAKRVAWSSVMVCIHGSTEEGNARVQVAEQQERLGKKINKKVMGMFDKAEQEYQEVMEKKRIVENDKMKIEAVMAELDEKKVPSPFLPSSVSARIRASPSVSARDSASAAPQDQS